MWDTLQDPKALKACIPGVETFEQTGPGEYQATMKIGVGSVKGTYSGKIRVFDEQRPSHYKLAVEAKGTPGFVRGEQTGMTWNADAQVGGTVAIVGQRMISGVAKMTVDQLWKAMEEQIKQRQAAG